MSEVESSWNLPFAPEFTVDAEGVVRKGGKPLPSHGLVQAIRDVVGRANPLPSDRKEAERVRRERRIRDLWFRADLLGGVVMPLIALPNPIGPDGQPSFTMGRREWARLRKWQVDHRKWEEEAKRLTDAGGQPRPAPKPPPMRTRVIPSLPSEPYPAHGDLARGWVVLELPDGMRVLLHGPSVAAMAPEFIPWK